jgi:alpha-galactosidase
VGRGPEPTRLTRPEQRTLLTLWSIARSPLILGGDLTRMDDFTLSLITNPEVLAVDQASSGNRQLFNDDGLVAWIADAPGSTNKYLALFNTRDAPPPPAAQAVVNARVKLADLGCGVACRVRDLWLHQDLGEFSGEFAPEVEFHGAGLYRVSAKPKTP